MHEDLFGSVHGSPEGFDLAALQGYDHEFGIKAMELVLVRSFLSIIFLPFGLASNFIHPIEALPTLLPICIIYQIWCFLKVFLRRKKLRTTALVLTMVLFLSLFAVDPLSRIIRTNRDIPPLITDYLEELYGSDAVSDMKIILEDKVDCRYTVQSTPEGTLTLYYYPGGSRRSSDGTIYEDPDGPVDDATHGRVYYGPGHDNNYEYGE